MDKERNESHTIIQSTKRKINLSTSKEGYTRTRLDETTLNVLRRMIDQYVQDREVNMTQQVVNQVLHKKRKNK
jgi:hypothetical protein